MFSAAFFLKSPRAQSLCSTHTHIRARARTHARKHTKEHVQESGKSIAFMFHCLLCACVTFKIIVLYISVFTCFSGREEANIILSSL